jgi:hypothetical protein
MEKIKEKLAKISPFLNERQRRVVYAAEAPDFVIKNVKKLQISI